MGKLAPVGVYCLWEAVRFRLILVVLMALETPTSYFQEQCQDLGAQILDFDFCAALRQNPPGSLVKNKAGSSRPGVVSCYFT